MTLGKVLRRSALRDPQKTALIAGAERITYEALDRSTDALARWLLREGLEEGDRVAIHWCNSVEVVHLFFACFKAGLITVPVNTRLKSPEIAYVLAHSQARLCFSQPEFAPLSEAVRGECPALERICTLLPELDVMGVGNEGLPEVSADRLATVLYTSGTTARPKGVMHSHISCRSSAGLMLSLGMDENDIVLAGTQMMHISALCCALLPAISSGATMVLLPAFDAARALDLVERHGCTCVLMLPTMLRFMVEEQERHPRDVSSVSLCMAGGDAVPVALQERFRALFGIPVRELYGMTESVPVTCIREGEARPGSVGPALDLVDTRVTDFSGKVVAEGEVGELQVQSPANCVGYWDDAKETAAAFDDGWLRTGDLVRRDADGCYWFEGRVKQIIIRGGSNISPQEVEEALYRHPAVLEAGVVGMPDAAYGEKVIAFVSLREGCAASEQELRESVRGRIADYKVPERILLLAALPKGLTGKVQRRELKELAERLDQAKSGESPAGEGASKTSGMSRSVGSTLHHR